MNVAKKRDYNISLWNELTVQSIIQYKYLNCTKVQYMTKCT